MKSPFFWRITIPYILLIIIIMGALGLYLSANQSQNYQDSLKSQLLNEARLLAKQAEQFFLKNSDSSQLDALAKSESSLIAARITIIRADGVVLGESDTSPAAMENHLTRPEVQGALQGVESTTIRFSTTLQADFFYAAVPIQVGGKVVGVARVAVRLQIIDQTVNLIRQSILSIAVIMIGLSIVISFIISYFTVKPLRDLTEFTNQLRAPQQTDEKAPLYKDEIHQLEYSINRMATELTSQLKEIQSESAQLSAVLDTMSDGILIVDENGSVQLINPAAAILFDVKSSQVSGLSLAEVVRNFQVSELWEKSNKTQTQLSTPIQLNQNRAYIQAVAEPLGDSLPGSTLMIFQDLTRIHRLEIIRRDFVSNVSHELRTPLSSLKALVETLEDGAIDDKPAAEKFLNQMNQEIDNMVQMVEELLELSRIESGKVPLKLVPSAPDDLIHSAIKRMELQAERNKLTLTELSSSALPKVLADPQRIEQVLVNLIHNAIKFTPPGGKITISAEEKQDEVIFSVQDSGVGISPDDLSRVFERFYKTDRARSTRGTGLGLSIARHLMDAHKGKIWAESELDKGSTFHFSLPKA